MRKIDATSGPLFKSIITYAIPLIFTSIVQELFTAVDKAVLGNMADTAAVASVGVTLVITNLLTACFIGISSGASVVLARYIGQRDAKSARNTINTALISSVGFGVIIAVFGCLLSPTLLNAVECPEDCYRGSLIYLRIFFLGAPIMLFYNYSASILRTLGDSKSPLKYIMIGGGVNVVLNIILCFVLAEKVAAVAIATFVSNLISAVLSLHRLTHFDGDLRLSLRDMRLNLAAFALMLKFGIPTAISGLIWPLTNVQIATAINSFGVDAVAGNSAAISLQSLTTALYTGFGIATVTFMGQNIGAQQPMRVRKTFNYCMLSAAIISETFGVMFYFGGRFLIGLIVGMDSVAAIEYGMIRMLYISLFTFIFAINNVLNSALQAYGYPIFGSISSVVFTLGFRTVWMQFVYVLNPTFNMVMLCFPVSISMHLLFNSVAFAIIHSRYKRGIYRKI